MEENPDDYMVDSINQGLMSLTKDRTVYHELENLITSFYNQHSQDLPQIFIFDRERTRRPLSLIFTKNSPLTPFFKKAAQKSLQSGLRDALINEWFGPKIKQMAHSESYALSIGQTFLIFTVMSSALILAFFVFLVEIIFFKKISVFFKSQRIAIPSVIPDERISFDEYRRLNTNLSQLTTGYSTPEKLIPKHLSTGTLFPGQLRSRHSEPRHSFSGYLSPEQRTPLGAIQQLRKQNFDLF